MANRVNVKFVVILSATLVVLTAGVALLAARVVVKSAEDHARLGDVAMQAGDTRAAESHYGRAVNRDTFNKEYLTKWIDAMEQAQPPSDLMLTQRFSRDYIPAYRQLAQADPNDVDNQLLYLNLRLETVERMGGYNSAAFVGIVDEAAAMISHHREQRPDDTSWWPLRRYNAIATSMAAVVGAAPTATALNTAIEDGKAALRADPDDARVAVATYELLNFQADLLQREQLPGAAEARESISDFLTSTIDRTTSGSGARVSAETIALNYQMRRIHAEVQSSVPADRVPATLATRVTELEPQLSSLFDRIEAADVQPRNDLVGRLVQLERMITPDTKLARSTALLTRALSVRPDDAELLRQRAIMELSAGEVESAISTYRAIESLPSPKLGLDGMLRLVFRDDATYQLAELLYGQAERAESDARRAEILSEVRDVRNRLASRMSSDAPRLRIIDARILLAEGKLNEAQAVLERLNVDTQFQFEEGLWLAGASAAQNRQPGLARQRFRTLVEQHPRNIRYRLALGEIEQSLGNSVEALSQLRAVQELDPTNAAIRQRVEQMETIAGIRTSEDPVEAALLEAQRLASGSGGNLPNPAASVARMERAVNELGPDPRLINNLTRQHLLADRMEKATEVVEKGLTAHPEDENMILMANALRTGDRARAIELILGQMQGDPGERAVAEWQTLQRLNEPEAAEAALERALQLAPDNPSVLEARLVRALQRGDLEQADGIANRASQVNADEAGGVTFRARVLQARQQPAEAVRQLVDASERFPNNTSLWRLLGLLQRSLGQQAEALASFNRALDIRPDAVAVINAKLRTLLALGRGDDALQFKRQSESLARGDEEFTDLHLLIEGEFGDTALVRSQREQRMAQRPEDYNNIAALAGLYIRDAQFQRADEMINRLGAAVDDPRELSPLRAGWFYEQGNVEGARTVFAKDIASRRPSERADAYLRFHNFLNQRGRNDEAVMALRQALVYQIPDQMQVDKVLGDVLMSRGDFVGANASYERIRQAGIDDSESMWEQRWIETLIRLGRLDEADSALEALPEKDRTLSTRLLVADTAIRRNDFARARDLLNRLASEHPNEALVYVKRAEAMADSPDLQRERLIDLGKAIELQPGFWQAYRSRAGVLASMNRIDEAVADLRRAVELNPGLDDVRINLVEYLMAQGREEQALDIAREAMTLKPRDAILRDRLGQVFARGNRPREATQIYRSALELDPTATRAVRVLDVMLSETPPRLADAETLLGLPIVQRMVQEDGGLRLMRARLLHLQRRPDPALREATEAYRALRPIARDMMVWFNFMETTFDDRAAFLAFLDRFEAQSGTTQWARFFRGMVLVGDETTRSQGVALLESHAASTTDQEVAFTTLRTLAARAYEDENYERAASIWKQAVDLRPNDPSVLNNLAYTLSIRLNRPQEGIPLATRASELVPNDSDVLHTLGVSLLRSGQSEAAVPILERSRNSARNLNSVVSAMVHLAEAYQAVGKTPQARELVETLQNQINDRVTLNDVLQQDLNRLRTQLGMN